MMTNRIIRPLNAQAGHRARRRLLPWLLLGSITAISAWADGAPSNAARLLSAKAPSPNAVASDSVIPNPDKAASDNQPTLSLTLDQAIQLALTNNPDLGRSTADQREARAGRKLAQSEFWPQLNAVGGYDASLNSERLVPMGVPNSQNIVAGQQFLNAGLVLNLPLFAGGRLRAKYRASDLLWLASQHRLGRTQREVAFNVASVFHTILGFRKVVEALEFSQTALQKHLEQMQELLVAQKVANVDVMRTEVRLASVEQDLVEAENILAIQHRLLDNLIGLPDPAPQLQVVGELTRPPSPHSLADNFTLALAQRADLQAAREEAEAARQRVKAARGNRWPLVGLQGSYGGRYAVDPDYRGPGASPGTDVGQVGVVVDLPLFTGGKVRAQIEQERARANAAEEQLRKVELQVRLDVQTAVLDVESGLKRIEATEKAVTMARESLRIEQQKYSLGKGSITDVLDAQSAQLEAEKNYARALADAQIAVAQLRLARGDAL